jgi:cell wall assembly regulator SMI1
MASWRGFREAVRTQGPKGRPATAAELDAYEAERGFLLPSLYREFASTFGAGRLAYRVGGRDRYIDFTVPGRPTVGTGRIYNIDVLNSELREVEQPAKTGPGGRFVGFAWLESPETGARTIFGWDLDHQTDAEGRDYAICQRRPKQKALKRVASTFEEFLVDYCVGKALAAWIEAGHPPDGEVPKDQARDDPSRIRFYQNHQDRDPRVKAKRKADPPVGTIHRLAGAPGRSGPGGEGIRYRELLLDDSVIERTWLPDGDTDRDRLEAFWRACQAVSWKDGKAHDVASPPFRPRGTAVRADAAKSTAPGAGRKKAPAAAKAKKGLIRRVSHEPAPVAESWRRIEAWMSAHCPEVVAALRKGLSDKAITAVEALFGLPLPEDLKASYRIHDGLGRLSWDDIEKVENDPDHPGLVHRLIYTLGLDRLGDARKEAVAWADVEDEPDPDRFPGRESFPADAIRPASEGVGVAEVFRTEDGDVGLGVDLDPGPNGVVGQVINVYNRRGSGPRFVLAESWGQFLEDYADELEAGNFEFRREPGRPWRELLPKWPKVAPLEEQWRAWSEAKLAPEFLAARPVPDPVPVTADPETDRACRAAVEGFIAEHHAWEVRWQGVRPVARLGFESIGETEDGDCSVGLIDPNRHLTPGEPIPEALRFYESAAWDDHVKRAKFCRTHLNFGVYHAQAMAEQRLIYAKYATAWRQRRLGTTFFLYATIQSDPAYQRPTAVLRRDATTAYVLLDSLGEDRTYRYKLKREDGVWRLERMQTSDDGKSFQSWVLDKLPRP